MSQGENELNGITLLITRPEHQAKKLVESIKENGGYPLLLPAIEIQTISLDKETKNSILPLSQYEWILFTSANGVNGFLQNFHEEWNNPTIEQQLKIGVVGAKTKKIAEKQGLKVDFIPSKANGKNLGEELPGPENQQILLPRGDKAREDLKIALSSRSFEVKPLTVYQTRSIDIPEERIKEVLDQHPGVIIFTSPSTIHSFFENLGNHTLPNDTIFACIGETTANTLEEYGKKASVVPQDKTMKGLLEELAKYLKNSNRNKEI